MWPYEQISREEFEKVKDKVEQFMLSFGAEKLDLDIPYNQTTTSYCADNVIKSTIGSLVFKYMDNYFRVDEVCFAVKPFIVFEFGTYDDVMRNTMDDLSPFPYDLSDEEIINEVKVALMIE
ncbi:MAG: hypothetical protein ACI4GW_11720 [Lachnospiraceae bacterium]